MRSPASDSNETQQLLAQIQAGRHAALDELLARHRPYLCKVVELRVDPLLRQRVDPSDIVQEAQLEATRRLGDFLKQRPMGFRVWLRQITYERLLMVRRRHADTLRRSVNRETPLPEHPSVSIAEQLCLSGASPSRVLIQGELARRVGEAMERLSDADRELLLMRNFEGLANREVAEALQIDPAAASKRYGRALLRLRTHLAETGLTESEA